MLDNYQDGQPVIYNILRTAINNKKISHAYLIISDSLDLSSGFALSLAKTLICPANKFLRSDCGNCSICQRIENGNFTEIKIINPDGLWIKKDQLMELQTAYKLKSLEGDQKIYIINQADRLNAQAANSILKFLEEPEQGIIALLTTTDIHNVLPTIVSRCQILTLKNDDTRFEENDDINNIGNKTLFKIGRLQYKDKKDIVAFVNDEKNLNRIEAIVFYIKKFEAFGLDIILENKRMWQDYFNEKEDYIWAFDMMAIFYRDVLNCQYKRDLEFFDYYSDVINFVAERNNINKIVDKIQKILLMKEKIKYNINLNLLMDKLILEMESR